MEEILISSSMSLCKAVILNDEQEENTPMGFESVEESEEDKD